MVGRHSSFLVTKRSLRNSDSTGRRLRQVVQTKNLDDTVGLSRREEQELNKALYASLQENRRCRVLPGFVDTVNSISGSGSHSIGGRSNVKGNRNNSDGCSTTTTVSSSSSSVRVSSVNKSLKGIHIRKQPPGCFLQKRLSRQSEMTASLSVDDSSQDSVRSSSSSHNGSKRKIHAQRKFAQGCSMPGMVSCTPVKSATPAVKMLSSRVPKTEDFLTFLCLRGSSILPAHLDFFNFSREELPSSEENSRSVAYTLKDQREATPDSSSTSSGANDEVAEAANVSTPPMIGRSGGGLQAKRSAARASAGTPETARGIVSLRQGLQRKVSTSSSSSSLAWPPASSSCLLPVSELTNTPPSRYRNKFYFTPEKTPSPSKASCIRTGEFTPPSLFSSATHMSSTYKFSPLVCCPSKLAMIDLPFGSSVNQSSGSSSSSSLSSSPICGASKRKRRLPVSTDAATTKVTCDRGPSVPSFCVTKCTRLDGLDCLSPHIPISLLPASADSASSSSPSCTPTVPLKSPTHSIAQSMNRSSPSFPSDPPSVTLTTPLLNTNCSNLALIEKEMNQSNLQSPSHKALLTSPQFKIHSEQMIKDTSSSTRTCKCKHSLCKKDNQPINTRSTYNPSLSQPLHLNTAHSDHLTNPPSISSASSQFDFRCLHDCTRSNNLQLHADYLPTNNPCILDCMHDHKTPVIEHCMCANFLYHLNSRNSVLSSDLLYTTCNNCADISKNNHVGNNCNTTQKQDHNALRKICSDFGENCTFYEKNVRGSKSNVDSNVDNVDFRNNADYLDVVSSDDSNFCNSEGSVDFSDLEQQKMNFTAVGANRGSTCFPVVPAIKLDCSKRNRFSGLMSARRKGKKKQFRYHERHRTRHPLDEAGTRKVKKKYCLVKEVPKVKIRIVRRHSVATGKVSAKVVATQSCDPQASEVNSDNTASYGDFQNEFLKMLQAGCAVGLAESTEPVASGCHRKQQTYPSYESKSLNDFSCSSSRVCPGTQYNNIEGSFEISDINSEDSDTDPFEEKCSTTRVMNVCYHDHSRNTHAKTKPDRKSALNLHSLVHFDDHPAHQNEPESEDSQIKFNTPSFEGKKSSKTAHSQKLVQKSLPIPESKITSNQSLNVHSMSVRESTNLADSITLRDKVISAFAKFNRKDIIVSSIDVSRGSSGDLDPTFGSNSKNCVPDKASDNKSVNTILETDFLHDTTEHFVDEAVNADIVVKQLSEDSIEKVYLESDSENECSKFETSERTVKEKQSNNEIVDKDKQSNNELVDKDKQPNNEIVDKDKQSNMVNTGREKEYISERRGTGKQLKTVSMYRKKQKNSKRRDKELKIGRLCGEEQRNNENRDKQLKIVYRNKEKLHNNEKRSKDKHCNNVRIVKEKQPRNEKIVKDQQLNIVRINNGVCPDNEKVVRDKQSHNKKIAKDKQSCEKKIVKNKLSCFVRISNDNQFKCEKKGKDKHGSKGSIIKDTKNSKERIIKEDKRSKGRIIKDKSLNKGRILKVRHHNKGRIFTNNNHLSNVSTQTKRFESPPAGDACSEVIDLTNNPEMNQGEEAGLTQYSCHGLDLRINTALDLTTHSALDLRTNNVLQSFNCSLRASANQENIEVFANSKSTQTQTETGSTFLASEFDNVNEDKNITKNKENSSLKCDENNMCGRNRLSHLQNQHDTCRSETFSQTNATALVKQMTADKCFIEKDLIIRPETSAHFARHKSDSFSQNKIFLDKSRCLCVHKIVEESNSQLQNKKPKNRKINDECKKIDDTEIKEISSNNFCHVCKAKTILDESSVPMNLKWQSENIKQGLETRVSKSDVSFDQLKVTQCVNICTQTDHQCNDNKRQIMPTLGCNSGTEVELSLNHRSVKVQVGICDLDFPVASLCQGKHVWPESKDNQAYDNIITVKMHDVSPNDMSGVAGRQINRDINSGQNGTSFCRFQTTSWQEAQTNRTILHSKSANTHRDNFHGSCTRSLQHPQKINGAADHHCMTHGATNMSSEMDFKHASSSENICASNTSNCSNIEPRIESDIFQNQKGASEISKTQLHDKQDRCNRNQTHVVQVPSDCYIACVFNSNLCGETATQCHKQTDETLDDSDDLIILDDDFKENFATVSNDSTTVSSVCSELNGTDGFVIDLSIHSRGDRSNSSFKSCSVSSCSNSPHAVAIFDSNDSNSNTNFNSCGEVAVEFECCNEKVFNGLLDLRQVYSRSSGTDKTIDQNSAQNSTSQNSTTRNSVNTAASSNSMDHVSSVCIEPLTDSSCIISCTQKNSPPQNRPGAVYTISGPVLFNIHERNKPTNNCEVLKKCQKLESETTMSSRRKKHSYHQLMPEFAGTRGSCSSSPKYGNEGRDIDNQLYEKSSKKDKKEIKGFQYIDSLKQISMMEGKQLTDENSIVLHSYGSLNTGQGFAMINGQLQQCKILNKQHFEPDTTEPANNLTQKCKSNCRHSVAEELTPMNTVSLANICSSETKVGDRNDKITRQQNSSQMLEQPQNVSTLSHKFLNSLNNQDGKEYHEEQHLLCQNNRDRECSTSSEKNKTATETARSSHECVDLSRQLEQVQISTRNPHKVSSCRNRETYKNNKTSTSDFAQFVIKPREKSQPIVPKSSQRKYLYLEYSNPNYAKHCSVNLKENANSVQQDPKLVKSTKVYENYSTITRSPLNINSLARVNQPVGTNRPLTPKPYLTNCMRSKQVKCFPTSTSDISILRSEYISDMVQHKKELLHSSQKIPQSHDQFDYPSYCSGPEMKRKSAQNMGIPEAVSDTRKYLLSSKPTSSQTEILVPSRSSQNKYLSSSDTVQLQNYINCEPLMGSLQSDHTMHQVISSAELSGNKSMLYDATIPKSVANSANTHVNCPLVNVTNSYQPQSLSNCLIPETAYNINSASAVPDNDSEENVLDIVMEELKMQIALLKEEIVRENQEAASSNCSKSRSRRNYTRPKISARAKMQKGITPVQRKNKYNMKQFDHHNILPNKNYDSIVESYRNDESFGSFGYENRLNNYGTEISNSEHLFISSVNILPNRSHPQSCGEHLLSTNGIVVSTNRDYTMSDREHLNSVRQQPLSHKGNIMSNIEHGLANRKHHLSNSEYYLSNREHHSDKGDILLNNEDIVVNREYSQEQLLPNSEISFSSRDLNLCDRDSEVKMFRSRTEVSNNGDMTSDRDGVVECWSKMSKNSSKKKASSSKDNTSSRQDSISNFSDMSGNKEYTSSIRDNMFQNMNMFGSSSTNGTLNFIENLSGSRYNTSNSSYNTLSSWDNITRSRDNILSRNTNASSSKTISLNSKDNKPSNRNNDTSIRNNHSNNRENVLSSGNNIFDRKGILNNRDNTSDIKDSVSNKRDKTSGSRDISSKGDNSSDKKDNIYTNGDNSSHCKDTVSSYKDNMSSSRDVSIPRDISSDKRDNFSKKRVNTLGSRDNISRNRENTSHSKDDDSRNRDSSPGRRNIFENRDNSSSDSDIFKNRDNSSSDSDNIFKNRDNSSSDSDNIFKNRGNSSSNSDIFKNRDNSSSDSDNIFKNRDNSLSAMENIFMNIDSTSASRDVISSNRDVLLKDKETIYKSNDKMSQSTSKEMINQTREFSEAAKMNLMVSSDKERTDYIEISSDEELPFL